MSVRATPGRTEIEAASAHAGPPDQRQRPSAPLVAGVIAGPLFAVTSIAQILTRDGFDLTVLPLSALSLGDQGWIQILNFVVYGTLMMVFAFGVRTANRDRRGRTAASLLLAGYGVGLVLAGLFVTDPALGFPTGAPEGLPERFSWHAQVHGIAASIAFACAMISAVVMARHFWHANQKPWSFYCAATAAATLVCSPIIPGAAISLRLAVGTLLIAIWTTALALRLHDRSN